MEKHIPYTDSYFVRTRKIIQEKGDADVTYAIFMRRPVTYAPKIALDWLKKVISERNEIVEINEFVLNEKTVKHPYFIAGQFHPEFNSSPFNPHPMFKGLVKAALDIRLKERIN